MATNTTLPPGVLNPYTPLAFLSPEVGDRVQEVSYVYIATLAVSPPSRNAQG